MTLRSGRRPPVRPRTGFRKDSWYWARYRYGTTLAPAQPYEIRDGRVTLWSLPWMGRVAERTDEVHVVAEIRRPINIMEELRPVELPSDPTACDWCGEPLDPEECVTRDLGRGEPAVHRFHHGCAARVDAMGRMIREMSASGRDGA